MLPAYAKAFKVPAFSGKINNHSALESSTFEVEYLFSCGYKRFPNDFTAYCGSAEYKAQVAKDGSFSVPETFFDMDMGEDAGKYTPELSTNITVSVSESSPGFPFGYALDGILNLFQFEGNPSQNDLARNFSIFQVDEQQIILDLASGVDPEVWVQSVGRDMSATFSFDFSNGQEQSALFQNDPRTDFFQREQFKHNDWTKIPKQLLIVAGDWQADTPVVLEVRDSDYNPTEFSFPYSSTFPEKMRTIKIDDTKYDDPAHLRVFDGQWFGGYLNLGYEYIDQVEVIKSGNYFTADFACNQNQLSGELIFRDGQFLSSKEILRVPVSGTCDGEVGSFSFELKLKSGQTLKLSVQVTKIIANIKEGYSYSVMASSDVDSFDLRTGSEVSTSIVLRDQNGDAQGTVSLYRNEI